MNKNDQPSTNMRILMVDDNSRNLNVLFDILKGKGYELSAATSGEMALKAATNFLPDLILLDIMMPGINGFETCTKLKSDPVTENIPVILFSREPKAKLQTIMTSNSDCLSLYWSMSDIDLEQTADKVAIQGNLNPEILLESNDVIKKETLKILQKYKNYPGYVFNLGHGITPNINPEKIKYLTDLIRST